VARLAPAVPGPQSRRFRDSRGDAAVVRHESKTVSGRSGVCQAPVRGYLGRAQKLAKAARARRAGCSDGARPVPQPLDPERVP